VWPGFGDNSRVLKWIVERLDGAAEAQDTPIGRLPTAESLDLTGLELTAEDLDLLLTVDTATWQEEAALIVPAYEKLGHVPEALWDEHRALLERLSAAARRKAAMEAAE
jgi:phosphoenolpyruvate carboxykinase (GTP)